jgi:hypothetical protein
MSADARHPPWQSLSQNLSAGFATSAIYTTATYARPRPLPRRRPCAQAPAASPPPPLPAAQVPLPPRQGGAAGAAAAQQQLHQRSSSSRRPPVRPPARPPAPPTAQRPAAPRRHPAADAGRAPAHPHWRPAALHLPQQLRAPHARAGPAGAVARQPAVPAAPRHLHHHQVRCGAVRPGQRAGCAGACAGSSCRHAGGAWAPARGPAGAPSQLSTTLRSDIPTTHHPPPPPSFVFKDAFRDALPKYHWQHELGRFTGARALCARVHVGGGAGAGHLGLAATQHTLHTPYPAPRCLRPGAARPDPRPPPRLPPACQP